MPESIFSVAQLPALGADASGIVVSGWSAGGHLTAMALSHPKVKAGMAISGIYDLEPIRHSYLNVKLGLDEAMSRRNSPMMQAGGPPKPLSLVVGSAELPLLRKQTADFAGHRAKFGLPVTYEEIPGANHFTILEELLAPAGRITTLIRQLFGTDGELSRHSGMVRSTRPQMRNCASGNPSRFRVRCFASPRNDRSRSYPHPALMPPSTV